MWFKLARIVWQNGNKITYKHLSDSLDYEDADKIGKEKGYGQTVFIGTSLPFKRRILNTLKDFRAGVFSKFPICCVLNFCFDDLLDKPSAQLRWSNKTDYVECCFHIRKHGKQIIPLDLY